MVRPIQWLINLAKKQPILFAVALLLIGLYAMWRVLEYQQQRIEKLETTVREQTKDYNRRVDSVYIRCQEEKDKLNAETKETLNSMIKDYKEQLQDQRNLNRRIDNTILRNERILRDKQEQLKSITNDN